MKNLRLTAVVCSVILGASTLWAQKVVTEDSPTGEANFILAAAKGGLAEIKLGKLAAEKSDDPKVKEFGNQMVTDHQKANDELRSVANDKKIKWPDALTDEQEATFKKLAELSGPEFDRQYVQTMVEDHQKDVVEYQEEQARTEDSQVEGYVKTTLPVLQHHLQMAKDLQDQVAK